MMFVLKILILLFKMSIIIFWILDVTNMPFMLQFDTVYPCNGLFWWLVWIFVVGANISSNREE